MARPARVDACVRRGLAACAIAVLGTLLSCARSGSSADASVAPQPVPDFALEEIGGQTVRLSDSAGQVRLVDFWATWCPPCREEIPDLKDLHRDYGDKGLKILAISMDDDAKKVLPPFLAKWEVPYTNLIGNDSVAEAFGGVFGLPTTFVVDREGRVVQRFVGGTPKSVLEEQVRKLLGLTPTG